MFTLSISNVIILVKISINTKNLHNMKILLLTLFPEVFLAGEAEANIKNIFNFKLLQYFLRLKLFNTQAF